MALSTALSCATPYPTNLSQRTTSRARRQAQESSPIQTCTTTTGAFVTSRTSDPLTFLIEACSKASHLRAVQAVIVKSGRAEDRRLLFRLLRQFSRCGFPEYTAELFERAPARNVYHYTAFIQGLVDAGMPLAAVAAYVRMWVDDDALPDSFVVSHVLRACASGNAVEEGRQVHGQVYKLLLATDRPVGMRLLEMYGRCGQFGDAERVFRGMPGEDSVAATILVSCYADHGLIHEALRVFEETHGKDTVCWTAMIDGLVRNGQINKALEVFRMMQAESVSPNEVTIVVVLSACSQLGALELGRWVHSYVGKYHIKKNSFVGSALIDMYSRCGSLEEAQEVFDGMPERDVVAYNSMIAGLALNGRSQEAVELFGKMADGGIRPTSVTFVGVLNACSHGGMVELAFEVFDAMCETYGIEPSVEHYGCMVDLLGRVGHLEKAYRFIRNMCIEPDHVIWGSLLSACRIHGNLALGEEVARILIEKDVADSGTYVLLSNAYASSGKWQDAAATRALMRDRGILKEPGCSSIEVDNEIHEFLLGDIRHPRRQDIYDKLQEMNETLRLEGYTPVKEEVLQDVDDEERKRWALDIHSERLAICFGLISTKPGSVIRVVKNLRVCNDCHSVIKLLSKVTGRRIVVRDCKRYHHFEGGSCSCGDFW